ncbi:MAG: glucokinase [Vicinamibacterales bacterium]
MILAGDVGGTKTLVGIFDTAGVRPQPLAVRAYPTTEYPDLSTLAREFVREVSHGPIRAACFGVAGPVQAKTAQLTNAPWRIDGEQVGRDLGVSRVTLLNDLQAMAYSVPVLLDTELHVLQEGQPQQGGHMAVIAAGTGLGESFVHNIGGRFVPSPSEGGHADWAARSERDIAVLRDLLHRFGRAEVEHVVSGSGLVNVHRVTHTTPCQIVLDDEDPEAPAAISSAALERRCQGCMDALEIFVGAFGAEAGNLALRTLATAGVFVGGGIAPKILPALIDGRFMGAFRDKAPFDQLVARVPVKVILNPEAGLVGAAVCAATLE